MAFLSLPRLVPSKYKIICGLDEVGRGPWAGPLVVCALILKSHFVFKGLKDSKQLSPLKREEVFQRLQKYAFFAIGMAEVEEIDRLGLTKATNLAYLRALENLPIKPDYLLIDGRDKMKLPYPYRTIIKGDEKVKLIACASIVAKVTRDRLMVELAVRYPEYGFELHKGYGTERHQAALRTHGICEIHRKSFQPVKEQIRFETKN
jgi:ribonuclease HII